MKEAIPGLDASLYCDGEGRFFWAVNSNWNPPFREKYGKGSRSNQRQSRDAKVYHEGEGVDRNSLASWGMESGEQTCLL